MIFILLKLSKDYVFFRSSHTNFPSMIKRGYRDVLLLANKNPYIGIKV